MNQGGSTDDDEDEDESEDEATGPDEDEAEIIQAGKICESILDPEEKEACKCLFGQILDKHDKSHTLWARGNSEN